AAGYETVAGTVTEIAPGRWRDLDHQQRLTDLLTGARPILTPIDGDAAVWLGERLGVPVALTGHGPDRRDRRATSWMRSGDPCSAVPVAGPRDAASPSVAAR